MNKKSSYDTSYAIKACNGDLALHLQTENFISEEVIREHFLNSESEILEDKVKGVTFYRKNQFLIIKPIDEMVREEYKNGPFSFSIENTYSQPLLDLLHVNLEDNPLFEHLYNSYINYAQTYRKRDIEDFKRIDKYNDEIVTLNIEEIYNGVYEIIRGGSNISIPIIYEGGLNFEISNKQIIPSYQNPNYATQYPVREFVDFEKEFPNFFNFLIFASFVANLKKPKDFSNEQEEFDITLEDEKGRKEEVKIKTTFLADLRIALSSLVYMDDFFSRDKGQRQLIRWLYPKYKEKIRKNIGKTKAHS